MTDTTETQTRERLQRGLRVTTLLIAVAVLFGLSLPNVLIRLDSYEPAFAQLGAFATLAAVLAVETVLLVRKRAWGRLRLPAVALILAVSALSYLTIPDGRTSTSVDWIFGAANWVGIVVLLDRPLRTLVSFLLAHELTAVLHLLLFDDVTRSALLRLATGSVGVLGYPLCIVVVTTALRRIATAAAEAKRETERVRTAEAIAAESHRRRRQRFAELSGTTVPLLAGLADGSLSPEDAGVQRTCAIEAARMRRLFAEADSVANPLLHELRHCADIADRKGVLVELDAKGEPPALPVPVRRDLTEAALTALATASTWARVTVVGQAGFVSVSVVADCGDVDPPSPATPDVRVETSGDDNTTWMEVIWQPARDRAPLSQR